MIADATFVQGRGLVEDPENPDDNVLNVPGSRQIGQSNRNVTNIRDVNGAFPSSADNPFPSGAVENPAAFTVPENVAAELLADEE